MLHDPLFFGLKFEKNKMDKIVIASQNKGIMVKKKQPTLAKMKFKYKQNKR